MGAGNTIALIKALAKVDPETIQDSVNDWLDDHPEATTTVQDGSITKAKLDNSLQATVNDVSDLKSALNVLEYDVNVAPTGTDSTETGADLDIADPNGNVLVRFANGEIKTSKFNSQKIVDLKNTDETGPDLDISDVNGNILLRMEDGNIETKKFKSEYIRQMQGIKWVCIGDSLTEHNTRTTKNYHDYIKEETGITVVNKGYSGSGYARVGGYGVNFDDIASNLPEDADVITVFGSGNDLGAGLSLGNPTDTGTTTLCGWINKTLDTIYENHLTTPLGVITPTPWTNSEPSDGETNMSLYCEAIVQICELRGIPCLDLFHCSNLHPDDSDFRQAAYSKDEGGGTHPDETGHKIIAPRIRQFLFSLI